MQDDHLLDSVARQLRSLRDFVTRRYAVELLCLRCRRRTRVRYTLKEDAEYAARDGAVYTGCECGAPASIMPEPWATLRIRQDENEYRARELKAARERSPTSIYVGNTYGYNDTPSARIVWRAECALSRFSSSWKDQSAMRVAVCCQPSLACAVLAKQRTLCGTGTRFHVNPRSQGCAQLMTNPT